MERKNKIIFYKESDVCPGFYAQDIVFVICKKPHAIFKREGDNLICKETITLKEALCGITLKKQNIDRRYASLRVTDVVQPNSERVQKDEGMTTKNGGCGDLIFRFDAKLTDLDESKKNRLKLFFHDE
jgi:DnaJ family protein B protein 4